MNTLPYTASCASNRLLTLLCKLNVNVERVLSGSANCCFCGFGHTNPEEVCVVKGNTLPDIYFPSLNIFISFFLSVILKAPHLNSPFI